MTYFKADYISGKIYPVEVKSWRDGSFKVGNRKVVKRGNNVFTDYASYHLYYHDAKDFLLKKLEEKRNLCAKEMQQLEEMINFAKGNY
jgi:hypothetical protein